MLGLMQKWPLVCHKIIDYAARQHPHREVVSRSIEGPIVRTTYADIRVRALKIAHLLEREGYVQLAYKHAVSTIQPVTPVDLQAHEEAGADD